MMRKYDAGHYFASNQCVPFSLVVQLKEHLVSLIIFSLGHVSAFK